MTQEEIEKACAEFWRNKFHQIGDREKSFKAGVEFAKGKMYSENEVLKLLISLNQEIYEIDNVRNWFNVNKKTLR